MRKRQHIIWGILFLLGAAALIIGKLGYLQDIGFWSILFSIVLCGVFISGLLRRSWGTILFSAALFIILHDSRLHLESITPWTVLLVALLGTIGLNMLFPRRRRNHHTPAAGHLKQGEWIDGDITVSDDGEVVSVETSFGQVTKYVNSQNLQKVDIDNSFGNAVVYLTDAALNNHTAKVSADISFGNLDLYIPASWNVVLDIDTAFSQADTAGNCNPNGTETLFIKGDVAFGHMMIYYVDSGTASDETETDSPIG